jgi:hypothetical protein
MRNWINFISIVENITTFCTVRATTSWRAKLIRVGEKKWTKKKRENWKKGKAWVSYQR